MTPARKTIARQILSLPLDTFSQADYPGNPVKSRLEVFIVHSLDEFQLRHSLIP
jgi:hypothetical protein